MVLSRSCLLAGYTADCTRLSWLVASCGDPLCVLNIQEVEQGRKNSWAESDPEGDYTSVKEAFVSKSNIGRTGDRFYYRVETERVECADGKTESVGVAVEMRPPDLAVLFDANAFLELRDTLEKEFVVVRRGSKAKDIKTAILDVTPADADKVFKVLKERKWLEIIEESSPTTGKMTQRVVASEIAPKNPLKTGG